jgi:hypothetical protein
MRPVIRRHALRLAAASSPWPRLPPVLDKYPRKLITWICPHAAGNRVLQGPDQLEKMLAHGNEIGGGTPEQFAALIRTEAPRWAKVARDAKMEPG